LCGDAGEILLKLPDGQGAMRYCAKCDFAFAWPIPQISAADLFSGAYLGNEQRAEMHIFFRRLANRATALRHPSLAFRSPIQPKALNWLEANIPEGAPVLEIGCGQGGFMHALRGRGFHAVGNDVAEGVVRALENEGFEMWLGNLEDAPPEWPKPSPSAVACFFVLHHIANPVAFLSAIRER
jgi:SAM-dependent methyltransferase